MTPTSFRHAALSALCILVMALASGCGHKTELLDSVPAKASAVLTLNPKNLDNDLNGKNFGGSLTQEKTLDKYLSYASPDVRNAIKTILTTSAIDREMIAAYTITDGDGSDVFSIVRKGVYIVTFNIADESRLVAELSAESPRDINGFTAYRLGSSSLLTMDGQGWLVSGDPEKATSTISRQLDMASARSIASLKKIPSLLKSEGHLFDMLVSLNSTPSPGWAYISSKLSDDGKELRLKAEYLDMDGKTTDLDEHLEKIDLDLLEYTSPSDVFVMALGLKSDTDWKGITDYIASIIPMDISRRALLAVAMPYLERIDGTIIIAAGTDGEKLSNNGTSPQINFFIGIELKKNEIERTMNELSNAIATLGFPAAKPEKGKFVWEVPGLSPITMLVVNKNCLAVTNRPIKQLGNHQARKAMEDNSFAIWANIPDNLAESTYQGPGFGTDMELNDEFSASFRFNGTQLPILEQLALIMSHE